MSLGKNNLIILLKFFKVYGEEFGRRNLSISVWDGKVQKTAFVLNLDTRCFILKYIFTLWDLNCKFPSIWQLLFFAPTISVFTYVILLQIWMIRFEAIVKYRYDDAFPCYSFSPRWYYVHVVTIASILLKIKIRDMR